MEDGTNIQGWCVKGESDRYSQLIYFGGNAQDVSSMASYLRRFDIANVYIFNYRGYGLSEGKPSEEKIYSDAIEIYDYVIKTNPNSETSIIGHSLGSAVAGHIAKHRNVSKLILLCPLHSVSKIAKKRLAAASIVLSNKFNLQETSKKIKSNTLVLVAEQDNIIPLSHSLDTFNNLNGEKYFIPLQNRGHNDVFDSDDAYKHINDFLMNTK